MASCITEQWAGSTTPQVRLTVTLDTAASDGDTGVLDWKLEYVAHGYAASSSSAKPYTVKINGTTVKSDSFNFNGITETKTISSGSVNVAKGTSAKSVAFSVSFSFGLTWSGSKKDTATASGTVSVPAKTSYSVKYSANGGSGAPSAQTKWYGTTLTLSSTKPTRTGYTFQGWGTTSTDTSVNYAAGASYTSNAAITLYAIWKANTYAVTYNANGGSNAPASQTKTYGKALTLTTATPTRENYNFLGWGTSSSATTVSYASGASYTANAAITLYAVWELAYIKPRITGLSVSRCDSSGAISDNGTYALIKFDWATDEAVSSIVVSWNSNSGGSGSETIDASGTSGSVNEVIGGSLSADSTYTVSVTVTDAVDYSDLSRTLSGLKFTIDALAGGNGIAFGKPSEKEGVAEFAFDIQDKFGKIIGNGLAEYTGSGDAAIDPDTTLEHLILTNKNMPTETFYYVLTLFYSGKADANNKTQIAFPYNANATNTYFRYKADGTWSSWAKVVTVSQHNHPYTTTTAWIRYVQSVIGIFSSHEDAQNNANRRGWMGFDGTSTGFQFKNETASGVMNLIANGTIRLAGGGSWSSNYIGILSDRMRTAANNTYYLGDSTYRWKAVYAVNGTIQTSDRNQKKNIADIDDKYVQFFDKLQPVTFEFSDKEHDRVHIGYIAQDVKAAMDEVGLTDMDFAGYCRDIKTETVEEINPETGGTKEIEKQVFDENGEPVYLYSLRYSEFIALNSKMIQLNRERIKVQQAEIDTLRSEVSELKQLVNALKERVG